MSRSDDGFSLIMFPFWVLLSFLASRNLSAFSFFLNSALSFFFFFLSFNHTFKKMFHTRNSVQDTFHLTSVRMSAGLLCSWFQEHRARGL